MALGSFYFKARVLSDFVPELDYLRHFDDLGELFGLGDAAAQSVGSIGVLFDVEVTCVCGARSSALSFMFRAFLHLALQYVFASSSVTFLAFLNADWLLTSAESFPRKMQSFYGFRMSKFCAGVLLVPFFVVIACVGMCLSLAVITLKLSQIQFGDLDVTDALTNGRLNKWSWNNFLTLVVIVYQIVNIVPVDNLQRTRLFKLQKKLFGPAYYQQKSNLYHWIAVTLRSRGFGHVYIIFYLASIDYETIEDVLKLIIRDNELYSDHVVINV